MWNLWLYVVFLPLLAYWKGGFKGWCLNTSEKPSCLTARWDFFYSDLTERQTGSVWAAGEEGEAPSQWESGDLLSWSWGPIISHQSLSTTESWLQWALTHWLCIKEMSSIRRWIAFCSDNTLEMKARDVSDCGIYLFTFRLLWAVGLFENTEQVHFMAILLGIGFISTLGRTN